MTIALSVLGGLLVGAFGGWHAHKKIATDTTQSGGGGGPKEPA